jgi:peptidoglycan/xylan/chitin deacetylase (PgdA/CDA1 family)
MISIVIPVLNEEKFLPDCLRSLRSQDYRGDYEIILADNGSTDGSARIARNFGARVVPCPEKKSVFYARQVGADAAHGDIIAQADADTIYPHDWLERIADQFAAHPKAVAVAGRFFYREKFTWAWIELFVRNILNMLFTVFFRRPLFVSGATFAFRHSAFVSVGGYRGLSYSADQYGIAGRLKWLGKILYDPQLRVITSARNVRKPSLVLLLAVGVNAYHLLLHWSGNLFAPRPATRNRKLLKPLSWGIASVLIFVVAFSAYGYFVPTSSVFGKVYSEGSPASKEVALTFDDGPNDPYTSQILDILVNYHIHATFFLIGKNVQLYPETARRILAEGNVIGNHSYSHNANHALTEYGARDLQKAEDVILSITGVNPHLYSPPHGKKSPWELEAVKDEGMIEVTWSVSANDQHVLAYFGKPTPEMFAREIVSRTEPGGIILMHDGYGLSHNTSQADKSLTVNALPLIIEQLQAKGYRFVTVPELLNVPAYNGVSP